MAGVDYQVDVAVYYALRLLQQHFDSPDPKRTMTLEPRLVSPSGFVEGFDLSLGSRLVEVKLAPSKDEVTSWLEQIARQSDGNRTFQLIHSKPEASLEAIRKQAAVAAEAGDAASYEDLARTQPWPKGIKEPSDRFSVLRFASVRLLPHETLREQIRLFARFLTSNNAESIVDSARSLFLAEMKNRRSFDGPELISVLECGGLQIRPAHPTLANLTNEHRRIIALLQRFPLGLHPSSIATALQIPELLLDSTTAQLVDSRIVDRTSERLASCWSLPIQEVDEAEIRIIALRAACEEVKQVGRFSAQTPGLVHAVLPLIRSSERIPADLAELLFIGFEHLLKDLGYKRQLLHFSQDCTDDRRIYPLHDGSFARTQARAWICGFAWYFQRAGQLDDALSWAQKSRDKGEGIGWAMNSAFADKCIGRLRRLQAEAKPSGPDRDGLLRDSARLLDSAIKLFSSDRNHGPNDREVGDCWSLLARTRLEQMDLKAAEESLDQATERIPAETPSKAYLDMLLLRGEVFERQGKLDHAEFAYQDVTSNALQGLEASEIRARAYFRLGCLGARDVTARRGDLRKAQGLWHDMRDFPNESRAQWALHKLDKPVAEGIFRQIDQIPHPATIKCLVVGEFLKDAAVKTKGRRADSAWPGPQLERRIQMAKRRLAEEYPEE